jgi:hypothetical protein
LNRSRDIGGMREKSRKKRGRGKEKQSEQKR